MSASDLCLHELFEAKVAAAPDAIAVIERTRFVSYEMLNRLANHSARALRTRGVGPEVLVVLCGARSIEVVVGLIAILKAGGGYVPIDPEQPRERVRTIIRQTRAGLAVSVGAVASGLDSLPCVSVDGVSAADAENLASGALPDNIATVINTSGSTGTPKGVMLTHRGILARLTSREYRRDEVACQRASLGVAAHLSDLLWPLVAGATVFILEDAIVRSAPAFARTLQQGGSTFVSVVPSHLRTILEDDDAVASLVGIQTFIVSGEPLTPKLARTFHAALPDSRLLNSYGMTETIGSVAFVEATAADPTGSRLNPTIRVVLLDDRMQVVRPGEMGEICVAGDQLARGYAGQPALTARRFVADPWGEPGARLYKTGDWATLLGDGRFELQGRIDAQVKIRGFLVDVQEVESCLELHAGVKSAAVIRTGVDDEQARLVSFVVPVDPEGR